MYNFICYFVLFDHNTSPGIITFLHYCSIIVFLLKILIFVLKMDIITEMKYINTILLMEVQYVYLISVPYRKLQGK